MAEEEIPFERMLVDVNLAKEMFHDNEHKKKQIPNIAKNSPSGNCWPNIFRAQSFSTSLMADISQVINRVSSFSRRLNGTFP